MTGKELKIFASQLNDDDIIFVSDWNEGWVSPIPLEEDFLYIDCQEKVATKTFFVEEVKIVIEPKEEEK